MYRRESDEQATMRGGGVIVCAPPRTALRICVGPEWKEERTRTACAKLVAPHSQVSPDRAGFGGGGLGRRRVDRRIRVGLGKNTGPMARPCRRLSAACHRAYLTMLLCWYTVDILEG